MGVVDGGRNLCTTLWKCARRGKYLFLFSFFFSEAISGFREKGDKCLSRNMGRLKLQYIYFFCNTPVSKNLFKWAVYSFFFLFSLCTEAWYFWRHLCIFFFIIWEWWIQQVGVGGGEEKERKTEKKRVLAQHIFDKACKGLRVESLPVEIC